VGGGEVLQALAITVLLTFSTTYSFTDILFQLSYSERQNHSLWERSECVKAFVEAALFIRFP